MKRFIALLVALVLCLCSCTVLYTDTAKKPIKQETSRHPGTLPDHSSSISISSIPQFSGSPFIAINDNIPQFSKDEITTKSFEYYSKLDKYGRCGETLACVGKDIMPTADRESISSVRPSGWINKKYNTSLVDGGYIYNRCHLIGFQLTGENANEKNLITGTRYMNVDGMLPFENMIADYVKETGNHVMLRVTPIFKDKELVARGVHMEAYSVEDEGDGISFNVFCYNVQPGITINYATGDSWLAGDYVPDNENSSSHQKAQSYVLNTNSKKFHYPSCSSVGNIASHNREDVHETRDFLISEGYSPCGNCHP